MRSTARNVGMIVRFAPILLLAGALAAQTPAAASEQDLRTRVTQFFQLHVDGGAALRRADQYVAEDTKDYYFVSAKMSLKKFSILDLKLKDDGERATVMLSVERMYGFGGHEQLVTQPMHTEWKVEGGQWMWFVDNAEESITPMAKSNQSTMANGGVELIRQNADGTIKLPDNLGDPKTVLAHAQLILNQIKMEKQSIELAAAGASEGSVEFRNTSPGSVILELSDIPENIPGLRIWLDKVQLNAGEAIPVRVRYEPPQAAGAAPAAMPANFSFRLTALPFNQEFRIQVYFGAAPTVDLGDAK